MEDYTAEMIRDMAFSFCPQCGTAIDQTIKADHGSSAHRNAGHGGTTPIQSRRTGRPCGRRSARCAAGSFPTGTSMVWNGNIAAVPVQTKDAGRRAMQMEEPLNIERDVVKNGVRLDCVFEGYEYRPEREEVRSQRLAGFECVEIAENTGLSLEQVTDYCRELGLPETGSCQLQPPDGSGERRCPVCGRILVQRGNSGRRRFCSPACREEYYRQHKPFRIAVCKNCGREFHAVDEGKRQRKFCSLNCYWDYRYGMKGVDEGE